MFTSVWSARVGVLGPLFLSCLLAIAAGASIIVVHPDGTGDYPSIQEAIFASSAGDIVELTDGTFQVSGLTLANRAITLRSQSGDPTSCLIVGGGGAPVVTIDRDEGLDTVLENITFVQPDGDESAIHCNRTRPTLRGCRIEGGHSGIYTSGNGARIQNCRVEQADIGINLRGNREEGIEGCLLANNETGVVAVIGGSYITIRDCTFVGNSAVGLRADHTALVSLLVEECRFEDNAMAITNTSGNYLSLSDCEFNSNGGSVQHANLAVRCRFSNNSDRATIFEVIDSYFLGNGSDGALSAQTVRSSVFEQNYSSDRGGALLNPRFVEDCLFVGNAAAEGGAIYLENYQTTISRCTFVQNKAEIGSAVFATLSSFLQLEHSLVTDGVAAGRGVDCNIRSMVFATCTNIFGHAENWLGCLLGQDDQDGNMNEDPLYCDPSAGDFTLQYGSPCAGDISSCGQIGSFGVGCGDPVPTVTMSWGRMKRAFR